MTDRFYVPETQRGIFGNATAWVFGILALVLAVVLVVAVVRWVSAPARGQLQAREQINSGATRIAAYDHFFNLCAAIQAQEAALTAQIASLAGSTGDDRERIRANIAGITAQRSSSIAQYNADAAKGYTIGQFRASSLPYSLDPKAEATSCVV